MIKKGEFTMKKFIPILLAASLILSMAGCNSGNNNAQARAADGLSQEATTQGTTSEPSGFDYQMLSFLENYDQYRYDGEMNVLYLVSTTVAEYFVNSYAAWKPVLKEHNINLEMVGPPVYTDESLINTLESALASQKYDLILLYPIAPSAITPYLTTAWNDYKTPIVGYAFSPETQCGHYYMGTSYYEAGKVMGQSILKYVDANKDYFDTLDTIPVAIYKNSAGAEQYQRIVGAMDILNADGRFSLINEYEANGESACLTATETVLNSYPDVEVILTQIDNDVTGAYQAISSGAYACSDYLSLWGFDATGAVCAQMYQDGVDGYVQGSTFIDHKKAAEAMTELLPILIGAAKQDVMIDFKEEEADRMGKLLAEYYVTVTPDNTDEYYTPN